MNTGRLVVSAAGIGFVPVAAGTVASAAAIVAGAGLLLWSPYALPAAALLATFGGLWAVQAMRIEGDPGWVVIDEVAGQWIAMLALSRVTVAGLLAAFLLFRFLDISKAGPVGWADRQHGVVGIMADDVIAGGITAGILWAAQSRWPGIFG